MNSLSPYSYHALYCGDVQDLVVWNTEVLYITSHAHK